jgi:hypothetical protein
LAAAVLTVLVNAAGFVQVMARPQAETPAEVISYLERAGLSEGYGGYWDANLLSAESGGKLKIGPVGIGNQGKLVFFPWYASKQWSRMRDARFMIFSADWGGVSSASAANTWGPPAEIHQIGKYHVLIWQRPLSVENPFSPR